MLRTIPDETPVGPLATPADLAKFRGAPFDEDIIEAAAGSVRAECGWHIAPSVEQTIAVRTGGSATVLLPSLRVTAVTAVTDRNGAAVNGWEAWSNGILEVPSGGFPDVVEITYTHGYDACPPELLPIIAERAAAQASGRIKAEALAGRSVQLEGGYDPVTATTINAYRIAEA